MNKLNKTPSLIYLTLVTLMRLMFGFGWLLAGITKITGKSGEISWFQFPGQFLSEYLQASTLKPQVPEFYKFFIEHFCMHWVIPFNYTIPIVQIILGVFIILGFRILPSVLICMFMHINFILSGNMNLLSLTLYTSAFLILLNLDKTKLFSIEQIPPLSKLKRRRRNNIHNHQVAQTLSN
ncbi:hypothetical protein [Paenibacillus sp. GSMTC-2017]|uniref:hypothetical protein n=1 Tax=Paenibacillus sp. GSMTC-2017 TaxID=2794350 RepID=UPI0018D92AEE|nr:hypothetical protein [Paenibacillus sp. GSMTC-2017]